RVVVDGRIEVDRIADVGLACDVVAAAARAAAARAPADGRDVRIGHVLEGHRTRVVEDEQDVRLDVAGAGLQREVREALGQGRADRQGEQRGSEGQRGRQGRLADGMVAVAVHISTHLPYGTWYPDWRVTSAPSPRRA